MMLSAEDKNMDDHYYNDEIFENQFKAAQAPDGLDLAIQDANRKQETHPSDNYDQYYLRTKKESNKQKASNQHGSDHTADTSANYKSKRIPISQHIGKGNQQMNPNARSELMASSINDS